MDNNYRKEILAQILEQTGSALLATVTLTGKLIAGFHQQTIYKQIRHGDFPLPTLRLGRHLYCRVHDLVTLLAEGEIQVQLGSPLLPAAPPRPRGRPEKYTQTPSAANAVKARAALAAKRATRDSNEGLNQ